MKVFKHLWLLLSFTSGLATGMIFLALASATLTDYRPPEKQIVETRGASPIKNISDQSLSMMIWNTGYAGLGAEMDFFYDGGKQVRPDRKLNTKYSGDIRAFIHENDSIDFILLQEVDINSKRSYRKDQSAELIEEMNTISSAYAKNYDAPFVPLPLNQPMGRVKSGLLNLSRYQPALSERISFPGNFSWPKNLFMPDRCFLVQRFEVHKNKELIVINTHNSAFDDGQLRQKQLNTLKEFVLKEYENQNYVIVGGDWNQNPPGFNPEKTVALHRITKNDVGNIPSQLMPEGWTWVYDPQIPTNRSVVAPYDPSLTLTTIIDFFLLSPNLKPESVRTINLGFEASDHNPVIIRFLLK
jgi:endonuclease/exonuclease/phosphatase family metal-dependent hydrolase